MTVRDFFTAAPFWGLRPQVFPPGRIARPAGSRRFKFQQLPGHPREALDAAKVTRAVGDVRTLSRDVLAYRLTEGALPETILDLDKGDIREPWGNPYEYLNYAATGNGGGKGNWKKDDGGIPKNPKGARKDKWLKPLNSLYDLYSKGRDGESLPPLSAKVSWDDIVMASDGAFIGLAKDF